MIPPVFPDRRSFLGATYGSEVERFVLSDGAPGREALSWAPEGTRWAVVTAFNPGGIRLPLEDNLRRQVRLRFTLTRADRRFMPGVNGEGEWAEPSFILLDVPLREAVGLGVAFGQAAVLWGVGRRVALVWCATVEVERRWVRFS